MYAADCLMIWCCLFRNSFVFDFAVLLSYILNKFPHLMRRCYPSSASVFGCFHLKIIVHVVSTVVLSGNLHFACIMLFVVKTEWIAYSLAFDFMCFQLLLLQYLAVVVNRWYTDFNQRSYCSLKGPWSPKLTYTFYPFSWKCRILW